MNIIDKIEREGMRKDVPDFDPGDTVRVHVKIVEGDKERIQVFEGTVIGRQGGGLRERFRVRKLSYGVGGGAHLPGAFPASRQDRSDPERPRAPREALLPERPQGQGRPGEGARQEVGRVRLRKQRRPGVPPGSFFLGIIYFG